MLAIAMNCEKAAEAIVAIAIGPFSGRSL